MERPFPRFFTVCVVFTAAREPRLRELGRLTQPRPFRRKRQPPLEKPRPRRSFTSEFKAEIVELCRRGDRSVGQIAKDFDLTETAVRDWAKPEVEAGGRDGLTSSEREELAALRRENRRLREDVDILKRATAFFAKATGDGAAVHRGGEAEHPQRQARV
ncbi:transposase [Streptomyces sp. R33]|uniref:Transposase n=1 Tax=Streptomyces sp. R33 TaxID=3238629 RepID=A0AB39YFN2_9ACTN